MLGKRLKKLRGKKVQEEMAKIIGVSRATYSHWENDRVQPDHAYLQKIADYYDVSVDYLFGRTNNPNNTLSPSQAGFIDKLDLSDEELVKFPIMFEGRELTDEEKKRVIRTARALLHEDQK